MRRAIGWLFAVLTLVCGFALAATLLMFFSPRDARYTTPLLVTALIMLASTAACGLTARRMLSEPAGASLWPVGVVGGALGVLLVYFYANMGH